MLSNILPNCALLAQASSKLPPSTGRGFIALIAYAHNHQLPIGWPAKVWAVYRSAEIEDHAPEKRASKVLPFPGQRNHRQLSLGLGGAA